MKDGSNDTPESKYQTILITCLESIKKAIPSKYDKNFGVQVKRAIGTHYYKIRYFKRKQRHKARCQPILPIA